jgi:hypothetical protein
MAITVYAKQAQNTDAERKVTEIRLRAEKRAGQLMRDMKESHELRPQGKSHVAPYDMMPKLEDIGISRDQASKMAATRRHPRKAVRAGATRTNRVRNPEIVL